MPRKIFRQTITSPELWEKVNPKNISLMQRFLKEKNTRCSNLTVEGYDSDLRIFFTWNLIYNENKYFLGI
jgi:hypothetical protein